MSNILLSGDWHIRTKNPVNRIGNYEDDIFTKLQWIVNTAKEYKCVAIVQPGDFFDHRRVSNLLLVRCMDFFFNSIVPVLTIFGQHDMRYHRNKDDTALKVMETAEAITLLGDHPYNVSKISFYGASWNEPIPIVKNKEAINILVTHRMVIDETPLWPGQVDYVTGKRLRKQCKDYDVICCGDNHNTFQAKNLVNAGSLMRSTMGQIEHKPTVFIYDTDTKKIKSIEIPVKPVEDVLKMEEFSENKERNERLESFIELLGTHTKEGGLNFEDNVKVLRNKAGLTPLESNLVDDFIATYYEGEN